MKVYRDGDDAFPTICGTGLEDYVGSAWGMGAHSAPFAGAPLVVGEHGEIDPDFVGFYRWHLPDPIMFERELRVTIQQIGAMFFTAGQEEQLAAYEKTNPVAGTGWSNDVGPGMLAWGIVERVDDYCATAYVYCTEVQPVPRLDVAIGGRRHRTPRLRIAQSDRAAQFGGRSGRTPEACRATLRP